MSGATPWLGLAALAAMFLLPYLPAWLFEGPRTIRHRPQRHVCDDCGAPWTAEHACPPPDTEEPPAAPLRGQLRRLDGPDRGALARRPGRSLQRR
jgi:hypothetical protein